ncbi:MAG: rane protein insertase, YidC/Oxa1 family, preprotein translocase subunit YidC [Candidatus Magasanikbacteria bacterium]|nr:rane protein insertase, YidC/Oxa1 family, preprotein translocase subunit YidC [Candidatus Magasanikbacteria bacterium]
MKALFTTILLQPILNLLVGLYHYIPDIGVAIIIVTVVIRLILHPLSKKSIVQQRAMQALQPKLTELKEKYKDDKQKQAAEMMALYKENKVSPFSSCLPLLIQLPILLALYWALEKGLVKQSFDLLYNFVPNPGSIKTLAFGFLDLAKPNIAIAVLAGAAQFIQAKMLMVKQTPPPVNGAKDENMMNMMNKQMLYMMPAMTVFIGIGIQGGLTLYWLVTTIFTVAQQWWLFRKIHNIEHKT